MRIREKDAKKRQQAGGQEGTYRRKPTPVKRYAGDLLAPVSVTQKRRVLHVLMPRSPVSPYNQPLARVSPVSLSSFLPSSPQSYLQSLRDRQMGTGTSLSSMGTTNHTMIDLDYDSGSTAPLTATTPVVRV